MKNSILLICGLVITLVLFIFQAPIFEGFYFDNEFSNDMYNLHLYIVNTLITAISAWGFAAIFYYVVNSVSFSRWYHWLIMLAVSVVVCATASYFYITGAMEAEQLDYSVQAFHFTLATALVEAILFIVASFSIRWWSSNCRHTPFPE